jgi:hypothetical protein
LVPFGHNIGQWRQLGTRDHPHWFHLVTTSVNGDSLAPGIIHIWFHLVTTSVNGDSLAPGIIHIWFHLVTTPVRRDSRPPPATDNFQHCEAPGGHSEPTDPTYNGRTSHYLIHAFK